MMEKYIPLSVPNLCGNELKYVTEAITSEWVSTGGSFVTKFEKDISKYLNVDSAVAVQSGTSGIHLALKMCDVLPNDEVIVPTLTFIAAVNPIRYLNAYPIFMDCDDNLTMDLDKLEEFLEKECLFNNDKVINKRTRKQIKAIIIIHVFGNMPDMERLLNIKEKYNLKLIEDATEALGSYILSGKYKSKYAGTLGNFGVFSFNGNKIITTGGGGMVVSKNNELLNKIKYLSTQAKDDEVYFIHNEIGYNYRMTNLQAALGVAQLENLEKFIVIKKSNYDTYKEKFKDYKYVNILDFNRNIRSNYWFYSFEIDKNNVGTTIEELINCLNEYGIQARPIWKLNHLQKPYLSCESYKIERALFYYERIINLPCSTNLKEEEVKYISEKLKLIVNEFSRDN